jgi:hypothetical protein
MPPHQPGLLDEDFLGHALVGVPHRPGRDHVFEPSEASSSARIAAGLYPLMI